MKISEILIILLIFGITHIVRAQNLDHLKPKNKIALGHSCSIRGVLESLNGDMIERKISHSNILELDKYIGETDSVSFKICINILGSVTYVELIGEETTISNKNILKKFFKVTRDYKFENNHVGSKEECLKLKFKQLLH